MTCPCTLWEAGCCTQTPRKCHTTTPHVRVTLRCMLMVAAQHRSVIFTATLSAGAFFGSIAPRLQPRFYSISSAPAAHPGAVHITCAVVHDTTPSGRTHEGIASFFLKRAAVGVTTSVSVGYKLCLPLHADISKPSWVTVHGAWRSVGTVSRVHPLYCSGCAVNTRCDTSLLLCCLWC